MLNKILNNKIWTLGIIIVIVGIIISISLPLIFKSFELVMGLMIVVVGIIMICQIFKLNLFNTYK